MLLRQMVQQAKDEGLTINVRHAKLLFCGASHAGKTSFSRLLRNQEHQVIYKSTPAGDAHQVLISGKINVVGANWINLDDKLETEELTKRLIHKFHSKTDDKRNDTVKPNQESHLAATDNIMPVNTELNSQTVKVHPSATKSNENLMPKESISYTKSYVPKVNHELPRSFDDNKIDLSNDAMQINKRVGVTEEKMVGNFNIPISESLPKTWDLFTFLDTGGQPQFINMLPAINACTAITFVVLNMSSGKECLNEPVLAQYKCKGYNYGNHTLNYTNMHLLKCLLSSVKVAALKKDDFHPEIIKQVNKTEQSQPVVCFIGTCADILKKKLKEKYDEAVREINQEVKKLAEVVKKEGVLEFWCDTNENYVIVVDNTISREQGVDVTHEDLNLHSVNFLTIENIQKIRANSNALLWKKAQYEIPLAWFILELELRSNPKVCIPLREVKDICNKIMPPHRKMKAEQIEEVLKFFHLYGMLLYFGEVNGMKDFVITNPQWLFVNLTKIIMCKFEDNAIDLYGAHHIKNMYNGICSMELLRKLKLDVQGIRLESFLELLVHLRIIAPMINSEYFMPTVLPPCNKNTIINEKEYGKPDLFAANGQYICSVQPLLIEFTFGTVPRGLFGFLIVQLLQDNKRTYELYGENNESGLYRCVDFISFYITPCYYISLHDKISYLELQVRVKGKKCSYYYKVQNAVTEALKKVCDKFNWQFTDCRYGFLCNQHTEGSHEEHLALLDTNKPFPNQIPEDACCKYQQSTCLNKAHSIWFEVC